MQDTRTKIQTALSPIQPIKHSTGYQQLILTIEVILDQQLKIYNLQNIFPMVAAKCSCTPGSIERNIRTFIKQLNREQVEALTGFPVYKKITVKYLIALLVECIRIDTYAA